MYFKNCNFEISPPKNNDCVNLLTNKFLVGSLKLANCLPQHLASSRHSINVYSRDQIDCIYMKHPLIPFNQSHTKEETILMCEKGKGVHFLNANAYNRGKVTFVITLP